MFLIRKHIRKMKQAAFLPPYFSQSQHPSSGHSLKRKLVGVPHRVSPVLYTETGEGACHHSTQSASL